MTNYCVANGCQCTWWCGWVVGWRWSNAYNVPISAEPERRVHVINDTLVLRDVIQADTGNYTCHVTNMAATRAKTVSVVVSGNMLYARWLRLCHDQGLKWGKTRTGMTLSLPSPFLLLPFPCFLSLPFSPPAPFLSLLLSTNSSPPVPCPLPLALGLLNPARGSEERCKLTTANAFLAYFVA